MFNGSENAPGDYFEPLREIGATDFNGTTWFDRTNYFQTVPTPALERALFLESDRMGHLLGAVNQERLDNQRGVVQNEKRQGDNQPYGLVEYAQLEALFPEGHPYRHSTIGSMADLDAASLEDVRHWFRDNYGPNNAVLVLAGDIDAAEARPLVESYFGDIPRGPVNEPAAGRRADPAGADVDQMMHDRVANTRLYRNWVVPGPRPMPTGRRSTSRADRARRPRQLAARQRSWCASDQTAVGVTACVQPFHRVSLFEVQVDVKPGQDAGRGVAPARRRSSPTSSPTARPRTRSSRAVMRDVAGRIRGLEQVGGFGGKAVALAEGALYADDPEFLQAPRSSSWRGHAGARCARRCSAG